MTELVTYNLESFVEFLKKNNFQSNEKINKFSEIVKFFDNSLGGCGCNRNTRVQFANDFYSNFIRSSTSEEDISIIKELTFSQKVVFVDSQNVVVKEF